MSLPGCVSSETAGVLGRAAGGVAGSAASYAGAGSVGSSAVYYGSQAATAIVVAILEKHEATELQRKIAQERAEAYMAGLKAAEKQKIKKQRYIAVDTQKDSRSKGKASVMVFDTQNDRLVGNDVYELQKAPPVGSAARFETVDATYVGAM